ncbi:hypothetical protein B0H14DRAFT_3113609 [Mycena olivaceomarginata]|nr:hypothetical protein B0H14DRAFT_3113609 [Mycena olivaceomarginata]
MESETLAYIEERNKRARANGLSQFVRLADSTQFNHLQDDPWVDHAADGDDIKFLVLGAGYGGLLFAVHLIEAGFSAADIRMAGWRGRETGYMPRFKYAYGPELRAHADRIAEKWGLTDKALFRTQSRGAQWDDAAKRWIIQLVENRGPTEPKKEIKIKAQYVFLASGILDPPHIPLVPGFEQFKGQHFHTARWNYDITGGTDTDWTLDKLKDKRVGILGTGATAVQAVPHLAKWAKHLYVFQRTPSYAPPTPYEWANKIAAAKGWQRARSENFNSYLVNAPIGEDLVNDGWCHAPSYQAVIALVHTDGKSVDALTADAVVVDGTPYPVDVLVLSTGFAFAVAGGSGSPAQRGVAAHGFPNFFFLGSSLSQIGVGPNFTYTLAILAEHVATTLAEAERRAGASDRVTVEVTKDAEEEWTGEIIKRANWFAAVPGCTPGYLNREGEAFKALKAARGATWGEGIVSFAEVIKAWEDEGELRGFQVEANV